MAPLLKVRGLNVWTRQGRQLLHDISFELNPGEYLGIVGPSGAGKSVLMRSLLGMPGPGLRSEVAELIIAGKPMTTARPRTWRHLLSQSVGYIPQDALGSLDPLRPISQAVTEVLGKHMPKAEQLAAAGQAMEQAELDPALLDTYPHQLSGGMRQRVLIAAALVHNPQILVADEPTSALDATIGARVLATLGQLRRSDTGMLMISHDLASLHRVVDRVIEVRDGRIARVGAIDPAAIAANAPRPAPAPSPAVTSMAAPELEAIGLQQRYRRGGREVLALDGVDLSFHAGDRLGIVGESGSGKSTLIRALLALEKPQAGQVRHRGGAWSTQSERQRRPLRRRFALIPQDIAGSFNPRSKVGTILRQAGAKAEEVKQLLALVSLDPVVADQRTRELSGGMRQRVAIARALATGAQTLVCDEPFSALDPQVSEGLVQLLLQLAADRGLGIVMVTHDLGLVTRLCQDVVVMLDGKIVEAGSVADIWRNPGHPHTRELVAAQQNIS